MYSFPQFPLISSSAENNSKHTIKYHFLRPINLLKNVWGCVRSLLCVSCLLNNMKNKADHFFTRQTRKDESGDICNCTYIYTYLYMCGPKSWGQRVLRTKKKGPTTMNLSVTLSFCWHTHSHAAGHPVVYMCEKSLPQWRRSFLVVVAVVAPLFCLIIYMSKQLRVQFSSLALVMSCGGNFFIYLWCPQICAV